MLDPLSRHDALPISSGTVQDDTSFQLRILGWSKISIATWRECGRELPLMASGTTTSFVCTQTIQTFWPNFVITIEAGDRKSTRLNSSHLVISYTVFCAPSHARSSLATRRSSDLVWDGPGRHILSTQDIGVVEDLNSYLAGVWQGTTVNGIWNYDILCLHADDSDVLAELRDYYRSRRSEEHTSELQSPCNLVYRLLRSLACSILSRDTTLFRSRLGRSRTTHPFNSGYWGGRRSQ